VDLIETGCANRHPWEISRARCVLNTILPHIKENHKTVADIGCGDLYFTQIFARHFQGTIYAVDTHFENFEGGQIIKLKDIEQLEENSIDIAILMDVLEHIEQQEEFLSLLSKKIKKDGIVFFTVPAFQHLFSEHDVFLKHFRRYNKKNLTETLSRHFKIKRMFYFYSSLYLLRLLQFLFVRKKMVNNIAAWESNENSAKTKLLVKILNTDFFFNKIICRLSLFGLSLFAVTKKTTSENPC